MRAEEIVATCRERQADAADRETVYDALEKAYGGGLLEDRQRTGAFPLSPEDTIPEHIADEGGADQELVVNRVRSMVENTRAYIGQLPTLYAPPKSGSEDDMRIAERFERACYGLWDLWVMPRRMSDMGLHCSLHGTSIGIVWPDVKRKLPRFRIRTPRGCYPTVLDPDGYELADVIFYTKEPGPKAAKMLNRPGLKSEQEVEIIQWLDDKDFTTVVNNERVDNIRHKLGFCPALTIPNIGIPGSPFGESTVVLAVALQKYLNYLTALFFASAQEQFSQPIVLPNGAQWPEGLPHGPRDVIELPAEAVGQQAYRLPPPQLPFDVFKIRETLTEELSMVTDIPQAMLGGSQSPYISGRSVTAQLGPVQALMNVRMETIFPAIRKVMWMAFKMMEVMWPNTEHTLYGMQDVWGRKERAQFIETFKVEEFGGRYDCLVTMPSGVYFDEQAIHMEMLQDMQNQTLSKETYMQLSPFIKPGMLDREKERIKREVEENVQQNLAAEQMAQSLATQNAPFNEPGKTAFSIESGYVGEVPPAPVPGGIEVGSGTAQPVPESSQGGIDPRVAQAADLLRSIPPERISGRVFIVGDYLNQEYLDQTSGVGSAPKIGIALTDLNDKVKILQDLKKGPVPELVGNIQWAGRVTDVPDEPYLEVTPGSDGYDIQGAEVATPPEGGLLGGSVPETEAEISEEDLAAMVGAV